VLQPRIPNRSPLRTLSGWPYERLTKVVLLSVTYRDKQFIRVGYLVNNDYTDEQMRLEPPAIPDPKQLVRSICHDKPRVRLVNAGYPVSYSLGRARCDKDCWASRGNGHDNGSIAFIYKIEYCPAY
jgi:hypothetical protein